MPDFAVSTAFTAQDEVSKAFKRMGAGANKFADRSSAAFKKASKGANSFGKVVKKVLTAGLVVSSVLLLKQGLAATTKEFISFDQAITASSAKFKDLNLRTEAGQQSLLSLKKTARDVGAVTQFTATQAAQGLDFLAMAGFNAQQAMKLLPGVVDLATVAGVDLARSTDIASDALGAFGLMTKDTGQLTKNFSRLNDVMAKTMTSTNTDIETMFEAIKKGAPAFTAAGQSLESFNSLIGVMANSGVKGAEAGTSLRNMMLRLADPSKEAQKVLDKLNIVTKDSSGNFRDVVDMVADFEKGLKGMGTQQKTAALSTVFGARSVTGFNILLKEGSESIRGFRNDLINATGSSKDMADVMRQSLQNRLASLQSAAIELGFKFIDAFAKDGGGAIDTLTNAVRNFDIQPIIDGVKFAFNGINQLIGAITPFLPLLKEMVIAFVAYTIIAKAFVAINAAQAFFTLASGLSKTMGTFKLLKAVFMTNPIGFVVAGVFLLIKGLQFLQRKFKIFDPLVEKFKFLKSVGNFFSDPIGSVFGNEPTSQQGIAAKTDNAAQPSDIVAPNTAEVEARQAVAFKGLLQIAGAPEGSTVESKTTGAPEIALEVLGINP